VKGEAAKITAGEQRRLFVAAAAEADAPLVRSPSGMWCNGLLPSPSTAASRLGQGGIGLVSRPHQQTPWRGIGPPSPRFSIRCHIRKILLSRSSFISGSGFVFAAYVYIQYSL